MRTFPLFILVISILLFHHVRTQTWFDRGTGIKFTGSFNPSTFNPFSWMTTTRTYMRRKRSTESQNPVTMIPNKVKRSVDAQKDSNKASFNHVAENLAPGNYDQRNHQIVPQTRQGQQYGPYWRPNYYWSGREWQ